MRPPDRAETVVSQAKGRRVNKVTADDPDRVRQGEEKKGTTNPN